MGVNPGGGGHVPPPSEGCPPQIKIFLKNHTLYCEKYMYVYLQQFK